MSNFSKYKRADVEASKTSILKMKYLFFYILSPTLIPFQCQGFPWMFLMSWLIVTGTTPTTAITFVSMSFCSGMFFCRDKATL